MNSGKQGKGTLAFLSLCLMCTGVVFGDIGTSPLYTVGEMFYPTEPDGSPGHGLPTDIDTVIGATSAMLWSLYLIVGIFYCVFALRADHHGEGGVMALYAKVGTGFIGLLLIFGTGLLMGDGAFTPPISILGGLEGLEVATPIFKPWIVPIALVILTVLFYFQYKGTAIIGLAFGPIMAVWFISIFVIGMELIVECPSIIRALNPLEGVKFLVGGGSISLKVHFIGSAMLAITGCEALYADLGHFSKWSIRVSFSFVVICITANYLGQGAFIAIAGEVIEGKVFHSSIKSLYGDFGLYVMTVLGTLAAIIASQALITGLFSLVAMAIAKGLLWRVKTLCTSDHHKGQIYQPATNWILFAACVAVTLIFETTKRLGPVYGLAIASLMLFDCFAIMKNANQEWKWSWLKVILVFAPFAIIETAFVLANGYKFKDGGYYPYSVGVLVFIVMTTWKWGGAEVAKAMKAFSDGKDVNWLVSKMEWLMDIRISIEEGLSLATKLVQGNQSLAGINRNVVYLVSRPIKSSSDMLPSSLVAFFHQWGALPNRVVFLHVHLDPDVARCSGDRVDLVDFGMGVWSITIQYGYREAQDIDVLRDVQELFEQNRLPVPSDRWQFVVGEEELIADKNLSRFRRVRLSLLRLLHKIAVPAHKYLGLAGCPAVTKVLVPILFTNEGAKVCLPDLQKKMLPLGNKAGTLIVSEK